MHAKLFVVFIVVVHGYNTSENINRSRNWPPRQTVKEKNEEYKDSLSPRDQINKENNDTFLKYKSPMRRMLPKPTYFNNKHRFQKVENIERGDVGGIRSDTIIESPRETITTTATELMDQTSTNNSLPFPIGVTAESEIQFPSDVTESPADIEKTAATELIDDISPNTDVTQVPGAHNVNSTEEISKPIPHIMQLFNVGPFTAFCLKVLYLLSIDEFRFYFGPLLYDAYEAEIKYLDVNNKLQVLGKDFYYVVTNLFTIIRKVDVKKIATEKINMLMNFPSMPSGIKMIFMQLDSIYEDRHNMSYAADSLENLLDTPSPSDLIPKIMSDILNITLTPAYDEATKNETSKVISDINALLRTNNYGDPDNDLNYNGPTEPSMAGEGSTAQLTLPIKPVHVRSFYQILKYYDVGFFTAFCINLMHILQGPGFKHWAEYKLSYNLLEILLKLNDRNKLDFLGTRIKDVITNQIKNPILSLKNHYETIKTALVNFDYLEHDIKVILSELDDIFYMNMRLMYLLRRIREYPDTDTPDKEPANIMGDLVQTILQPCTNVNLTEKVSRVLTHIDEALRVRGIDGRWNRKVRL